ncbi:oxidoreductase [Agrobacterium tumefaciens]|uniref:oxidoreductase n=1 Tax=Agrobacterium tumefaciens TaxID=358 RepID=UPI0021D0A490|nr:oxidoreductase [Agrobacterium tumefaciens]UXS05379.1 SDR family NAD(P)-dependent oxidoreductase [Agrobacterium tumefaciens]
MSKVWFITGAARGIGKEVALAALAAGDKVVVTGRNVAQLSKTYADCGDNVLALPLDVSDEEQAITAVKAAVAYFGRIDVLLNNAGFGQLGLFEEIGSVAVVSQFNTNVFGLFNVTRAVLPVMRKQRSGHVLNVSSIGGSVGFSGSTIYCATKYAVEGFSESLALEVAAFGIKVSIIAPGFVRTDFLDSSSVRYGDRTIEDYAAVSAQIRSTYDSYSHKQAGDPKKLANVILTLAGQAEPPVRLLTGSDAVAMAREKIGKVDREIARWQDLSQSTDIVE